MIVLLKPNSLLRLMSSQNLSIRLNFFKYYRVRITEISIFLLILFILSCSGKEKQSLGSGSFPASDFPKDIEWFNTEKPMKLADFRGKSLLLFFWSGSNLKSLDILEKFKTFERENQSKIRILAIHTPKYPGEYNNSYVKNLLIKNGIDTITIQDSKFLLWRTYGINNWNSLLLISDDSKVIGRFSVDRSLVRVDPIFEKLLDIDFKESNSPLNDSLVKPERDKIPEGILSYPEKIIIDDLGKNLYISDSNHHRVLIVDRETGYIKESIGNGNRGFDNGNYIQSTFNYPTGLELIGKNLFIVDKNNHSLRKVDLEKKIVSLFSGTGKKGDEVVHNSYAPVTSFSYPMDITRESDLLYLTNTGFNQFLKIDTNTGKIESLFSENRELKYVPDFYSKVGISYFRDTIYFSDSGSGSIKSTLSDFPSKIKILVGNKKGDFGDLDGESNQARLQFPRGIHVKDDFIYIADTLNHKIKTYDTKKKLVSTLAGTGKIGSKNGDLLQSSFHEPSNLFKYKNELYIADTNNHSIRTIDLSEKKVKTFFLRAEPDFFYDSKKKIIPLKETIPHKSIFLNKFLALKLKLELEKDYIWDRNSAFYFKINSSNTSVLDFTKRNINYFENFSGDTEFFPLKLNEGSTDISIESLVFFCEKENQGICFYKKFTISTIIKISPGGDDNPVLKIKVPILGNKERK